MKCGSSSNDSIYNCALARVMPGTLFLVSTPIGNLEDITLRALRVLREVSIIAAEDTRRTARLLHHYQIETGTTSFHAHNEREKAPALLNRLDAGESIALVTDAGTPVLSDPGQQLVQAAVDRGIRVEAIPGASAILAALVAAGVGAEGFTFLGFPPSKSEARKRWFGSNAHSELPLVLFEAPHRLLASLREAQAIMGDRAMIACRELTKLHEELVRGPISSVISHFEAHEPRGEFTLILQPDAIESPEPMALTDDEAWNAFGRLTENGLSRRDAVAALARQTQRPAREVYACVERGKARARAAGQASAGPDSTAQDS
jgi:16S rRNA (cytidine1402-2'-O)-methyltransferase